MRENWALGHSASFKNTLARACRLIARSCTWADQGAPNTHCDSAVENFHLGDPDGLLLRHAMLCQRRHPARLVGHEGDAVTRAEGHAVHALVGLQVHGRFCGDAVRRRNRGACIEPWGAAWAYIGPCCGWQPVRAPQWFSMKMACSARQKSAGSYQN